MKISMKSLSKKESLLALFLCAAVVSGCTDDVVGGDDVNPEGHDIEVKWARPAQELVAGTPGGSKSPRRVVIGDNKDATGSGGGLTATWQKTDNVGVWNISAVSDGQDGYDTVHPDADAKHVSFEGTVHCDKDDNIAVFYPYGDGTGVTADRQGKLTLDLSRQKGTLRDIAGNFDLVYGRAAVTNAAGGRADASLGTMTAGIGVFEFSFTENGRQIEVERVTVRIAGGHNKGVLDLNDLDAGFKMTETAGVYDTICIRPDSPVTKVYVAVFGESAGKTVTFDITDKYGFAYEASGKVPSSFVAGQISRAGLKAKEGDYIDIDGVKWAKGNLLWDNGNAADANFSVNSSYLTMSNYFIAPSQEWSPEQLNSTIMNFPVWPVAPPNIGDPSRPWLGVPSPAASDGYFGTFYFAAAGKHGTMSAEGRSIVPGQNPGSFSLLFIPTWNGSEPVDFTGRLWSDQGMTTPVDVHEAYNNNNNGEYSGYYYGDLAALVTDGNYRLPNFLELQSLFMHPNAVWGVYFIDKGENMKMRVGVDKTGDPSKMPIYGLYVNKRQMPTESTHQLYVGEENNGKLIYNNREIGYKGQAFILSSDDLKKGIFLPADGMRVQSAGAGKLNYVSGSQPGEYCAYSCGIMGTEGVTGKSAKIFEARPANDERNFGNGHGGVKTVYSETYRTRTYSIRPVRVLFR